MLRSLSTYIGCKVDDTIHGHFLETIKQYQILKRGDFSKIIELAMLDYIIKYSNSSQSEELVKRFTKISE